jgi:preprotein translocase subunit SecA
MGSYLQFALGKVFGTKNERELKRLDKRVAEINAFEPEMKGLRDEEFPLRTEKFKERLAQGAALDEILPEAFALCREAGRRTLSMRHFDVQLLGGMVLHEGRIAEMKTGEGKTLVATLPAYLNALQGKGVHIVTVNDYLAKRDSAWMGPIYRLLGLSVGVIVHDLSDDERRAAYGSDLTYGTNNEFGFDYLRDNMKFDLKDYVQRPHHYAIVDEVDSILIDEARTPLIISGSSNEVTDKYARVDKVIPHLVEKDDYEVDEKHRQVTPTDSGIAKAEELLGIDNLYDPANIEFNHHFQQALRAHTLFKIDRDYVVKDGEVIIVDEFTGRLMAGRRWSDGLHQAVEAKEGVKIESENQTLATVTFQNYFRMYKKLSGMTGTAETEAAEFEKIYNLEIIIVPTNRSLIRYEYADVVYRTEREKFNAVIEEIKEYHMRGQPVLVGSIAIEKSERLSLALKKGGVVPARLQEAGKLAGLDGPKLKIWLEKFVQTPHPGLEWLVEAGVELSAVKKMLSQGQYSNLASDANGTQQDFMQSIAKRRPKEYPYNTFVLPPVNHAILADLTALARDIDDKTAPVLDTMIALRCTPGRVAEVLGLKEVKHNVLNAKQHEREALIVAQAGRVGAVTVSTNMAGRGTDILLGGNPETMAREEFRKSPEKYREQGINPDPPDRPPEASVPEIFGAYVEAYAQWRKQWGEFVNRFKSVTDAEHDKVVALGGLHILCTERHEARRIDNQLRGRAGRQGDPGSSRFYLSLEDDLLRIFAGERISSIMHKLGMEEGVPIESRLISKRIESAQKAVEAQNFESRKHLLEYDDVMNKQRETVYGLRRQLLEGSDQKEFVMDAADRVVGWLVETFCPKDQHADQWNVSGLRTEFWGRFGIDLKNKDLPLDPRRIEDLSTLLEDLVHKHYDDREQVWGVERMRLHERMVMLQVVDGQWKDHLLTMDHLKEGIGLRGYSQRDPLVEYKRESFEMFEAMMDRVEDETLRYLFLMRTPDEEEVMIRQYQQRKLREQREMQMVGAGAVEKPQQVIRREKVGRNDPCPCGSGKKYKKCHGAGAGPEAAGAIAAKPKANGPSKPESGTIA